MNIPFHRITKPIIAVICLTGIIGLYTANAAADPPFSYADYAADLKACVDDRGLVNYKELKAHRGRLDTFAKSLGKLSPETYAKWTDDQKIAFWINAYNALTLVAIIDHYPIKASFFKSILYPKNSIRQIPGVWTDLRFPVMGREMTLDQIEHETLRAMFNEPRIHMALVCAAMSCPILRNEPYTGDKLDEQLNDQAAKFVKDPKNFRIDKDDGVVYLSSIFKWFGKDFVKTYGAGAKIGDLDETERTVINFISRYLNPSDKAYVEKGGYAVSYVDYDWSLNEQSA